MTTNNPHFGPTRNPWNLEHIPGGSSGGSGAAIAAGLATATLGTDTGGSIRMPASVCGVVGLKPTYGRVSKAGVLPLSYLFDHAGPITRTVEDAALVLSAIAGYDPSDATTVRIPVDDYTAGLGAGLVDCASAFRVRFSTINWTTRSPRRRKRRSASSAGSAPTFATSRSPASRRASARSSGWCSPRHRRSTRPPCANAWRISVPTSARSSARDARAASLMLALRARDALSAAMRRTLESVDLLVTPTTPIVAARIGQETIRYGAVEESILFAMIRCTAPFNATGLPALSLPCGFTRAGLPIGLQIAGRPFDESTVLRAGHAYEQATEWHARIPRL